MKSVFTILLLILLFTMTAGPLQAVDRFPRPQFQSEYQQPRMTSPTPRAMMYEYLDVIVLFIALSLTAYMVLKKRSRTAIFWIMLFSMIYFGFWRKGCVCAIGSIQNVVYGLVTPSYAIPLSVILFFILPLIFALFFGRVFCAAVCPLGAIQDVVGLRPKKLPAWLNRVLGIIPYFYLGIAVLAAVTGSAFLICRFDPFIAFYRFDGNFGMLIFGALLLILGIFIARPYCRFLCPYGVLLGWMSHFSKRHASITPAECINCRLCEDSCPYDAIDTPTPEKTPETLTDGRKRLGLLILLIPVIMIVTGWLLSKMNTTLAHLHPTVRLAERIILEDTGKVDDTTLESRTFRSQGVTRATLINDAESIIAQFKTGGWLLGLFIGFVYMLKLIRLSRHQTQPIYEPNRINCLSCGRCFQYCPVGKNDKP